MLAVSFYLASYRTFGSASSIGASRPCGRRLISLRQRRPSSCSRCACRVGRSRSRTRPETKHSRRSAPAPRRARCGPASGGELRARFGRQEVGGTPRGLPYGPYAGRRNNFMPRGAGQPPPRNVVRLAGMANERVRERYVKRHAAQAGGNCAKRCPRPALQSCGTTKYLRCRRRPRAARGSPCRPAEWAEGGTRTAQRGLSNPRRCHHPMSYVHKCTYKIRIQRTG